jgi:hypothetical protein
VPYNDRSRPVEIVVVQETRATQGAPCLGTIGSLGHLAVAERLSCAQRIPGPPWGRLDRQTERRKQFPMLELERRGHDR